LAYFFSSALQLTKLYHAFSDISIEFGDILAFGYILCDPRSDCQRIIWEKGGGIVRKKERAVFIARSFEILFCSLPYGLFFCLGDCNKIVKINKPEIYRDDRKADVHIPIRVRYDRIKQVEKGIFGADRIHIIHLYYVSRVINYTVFLGVAVDHQIDKVNHSIGRERYTKR
jgi:hypothetical protein